MKILLVSETLHVGGAETFVVRLANALAGAGHEICLAVFFDSIVNPALHAQIRPAVRLELIHTPALRLRQKLDSAFRKLGVDFSGVYAHIGKQLLSIINDFRPEAVHTHLFKTDWVVSSVRKRALRPFCHIVTIHGDYSSFYHAEAGSGLLSPAEKMRRVLAQADAVVCLCEEHSRFFPAHFPAETAGKLAIVYNGYKPADEGFRKKTRSELGLPENAFLIGMVSRGVEKKGWKKAIDAFLKANIPDAQLVLVGEGDYLDGLRAETTDPRILFAGFSAVPVEFIQHFDICLLPSLFSYESLPTVVIEYLYCGKPVIATHVGEIPLMIAAPDGRLAGRLLTFDGQDIHVAELSAAISELHQSGTAEMGALAAEAFRKFDMDHCVTRYLHLYRD